MSIERYRAIILDLADELDSCYQQLMDDRRLVHLIARQARAILAEPPKPGPTDEDLEQLLFDNHRKTVEYLCSDESEGAMMIASYIRFARAVLALATAEESSAVDRERFKKAPCYICGYNGPGYYQPGQHPCASRYHATLEANG